MLKPYQWLVIAAALGALMLVVIGRLEVETSTGPSLARPSSQRVLPVGPSSSLAASPGASPGAIATATQPAPLLLPDVRNPFAAFQAAIRSDDLGTLDAGLAAWRLCAGYVLLGTSDIESWLTNVMPRDLPRSEWDRRAGFARDMAKRCAGFAMQSDAFELSQAMKHRAIELGSPSETMRLKLATSAQKTDEATAEDLAGASCNLVIQYPSGTPSAIRLITPAMRLSAYARPSHFLNAASIAAMNVGVNLAMCDLDPEGCSQYSNFIGSACVQSGKCGIYANEIEFWKGESTPAVWDEAQKIRKQVTSAVRSADCSALFR